MIKLIIGAIVVAVVVIGGFTILDNVGNQTPAGSTIIVDETAKFTIEGEVVKPGTYSLKGENITLADLIDAAGGTTSNADDLAYFETASLTEGSSYYIAGKYDASDICSKDEIKKVNINADTTDELMQINGITTSIASSIVSYRSEIGTYQFIEQLMDVYGVGNATYRKIRNYVTLHE